MAKTKTGPKKTAKKPVLPVPSWDEVQTKFAAEQSFGADKVGDYFPLGRVVRLQHVGAYGFVEYVTSGGPSYYRVYVSGRDTGISRRSIDAAIISALAFSPSASPDYLKAFISAACRLLHRHDI